MFCVSVFNSHKTIIKCHRILIGKSCGFIIFQFSIMDYKSQYIVLHYDVFTNDECRNLLGILCVALIRRISIIR